MRINKKLRYGGLSVILTALAAAIVILINILADTILTRYDVRLDLSENKLYSIEESTEEFLKAVDDDIRIIITSTEIDFTASPEPAQVNEIAKKVAAANSRISLEYVDLLTNPALSGEYGGEVGSSSIVVESGNTGRYKVLSYLDYLDVKFYNQNGEEVSYEMAQVYYQYGMSVYTDVSSAAEQALLSAIMQVSDNEPVRIAFTSGFGEGEKLSFDFLRDFLESNIYTTEQIDLNLIDTISDEIDYIMIFYPDADYTEEVMGKISAWLDNKGNYGKNLFYFPSLELANTPVLDAFLEEWGLRVEKGFGAQTDTNYYAAGDPFSQYITVTENDYTGSLGGKRFSGIYFRPITQIFTARSAYTTTALLTTYDGAVQVPFDAEPDWQPDSGERTVLNIAVESNKMRYDETTPLVSRLFVFGNPYNFDSSTFSASQYSNADYFISILNTLSGREEGIVIKSKSYSATTFQITAEQSRNITIVFCAVLPIIIIGLGIFVFIRRRFR